MCEQPGLFDLAFFIRTRIVYMREGRPRFYRVEGSALLSREATVDADDRTTEDEGWKRKMEARLAKLTKENMMHVEMIDKHGKQVEKLMDMVAGLVHDIQETKELQAYQFDPESYRKLTIRERPEILDGIEKDSPTTNEKKEKTPLVKEKEDKKKAEKKDDKKRERKSKDQNGVPPDDSSRSLTKK